MSIRDAIAWIRDEVDPEGRQWEEFYRNRWTHDEVVRSTHGVNCTGGCTWNIHVKDGIVTWEMQGLDYPNLEAGIPPYEPRGCQRRFRHSVHGHLHHPRNCRIGPDNNAVVDVGQNLKMTIGKQAGSRQVRPLFQSFSLLPRRANSSSSVSLTRRRRSSLIQFRGIPYAPSTVGHPNNPEIQHQSYGPFPWNNSEILIMPKVQIAPHGPAIVLNCTNSVEYENPAGHRLPLESLSTTTIGHGPCGL